MEQFLTIKPPEHICEEVTKTEAIDRKIKALKKGESVEFPIAEDGSVTARVCELNKIFVRVGEPKRYRTRYDKIHFRILVICH